MKKKRIVLKPTSGLGNRMRAISSFIYFKTLINAELKVVWVPDSGLNSSFQEIFQPSASFDLMPAKFRHHLFTKSKTLLHNEYSVVRWLTKRYKSFLSTLLGVDCLLFDEDVKKGVEHLTEVCTNKHNILVITGNQCIDYPKGFGSFVPSTEVASRIKTARKQFKETMIGIHIRRSDHDIAIAKSPVYLFENKIEEHLNAEEDDFGVFLATDDPALSTYFQEKYPDTVVTYPKTFGRNSREGIMDAVLELYLLAGTKKIYGSYWSSFSGVAKRIYGTELEILHI